MKEEILISSGSFGVLLLLLDFFFVVFPDLSHGPFTHHPPYFSTCSTMPICPYVPGMFTLPFNSPRQSGCPFKWFSSFCLVIVAEDD